MCDRCDQLQTEVEHLRAVLASKSAEIASNERQIAILRDVVTSLLPSPDEYQPNQFKPAPCEPTEGGGAA